MRDLTGRVAAVTGAGSGIGRALALALASEGCQLALCDVDEKGLSETGKLLEARSAKHSLARVDVADREGVFGWAEQVVEDHGAAHLIFNNAGVALGATVQRMTIEELEWLMAINFWGVVYGTKAFLPHLERAGEGHVVNLSSVFGLIAFPTSGAYNAAKFAARGFTEALSIELRAAGSPIVATVVHPGGIRTAIARNARIGSAEPDVISLEERERLFDETARTTADQAAQVILRGVKRDKRRVLVGPDARVFSGLQRLFPTLYQRLLALAAKRRPTGIV
ncbi:MAG: hypothetical protein CL910_09800 [Deltaproteobacteria bacterium]|jgi:NAD(P)-dependent dehydrogenase (short-subunit alcohol dehydrogenase family)|nr:hypothetical protein [Deltaproteobacteria bacterium]